MAKILIIDDEISTLDFLSALLDEEHECVPLPDTQQLFTNLEYERPDVILMDIHMPGNSGIVCLRQLKDDPEFWELPVLMMTSDEDESLLAECFEIGAADFLNKPIHAAVLRARLSSVLRAKQAHDRLQKLNQQLRAEMANVSSAPALVPEARLDRLETTVTGIWKLLRESEADGIREMSPESKQQELRLRLVQTLNLALEIWENVSGKTKIELAEESKIWSTFMEKSGVFRTRNLDKYLHLQTLPQRPNWRKVIQTSRFVLHHIPADSPLSLSLKEQTENLQNLLHRSLI